MADQIEDATAGDRLAREFAGLGSRPAAERERAADRTRASRPPADPRERERAIYRAARRGPRSLENAWHEQAARGFEDDGADFDQARYDASLARSAEAQAELVRRAHDSRGLDRVTARPGTVPARGAWETLIRRAHEEQARVVVGDRDALLDYLDPDDVEHENQSLGTAVSVARLDGPRR
jgi:hypothetical protein